MSGPNGWFTSSFSNQGNCVQVNLDVGVSVRNSKDASGPVLHFTDPEWVAFLEGVRNGEFDLARQPTASGETA